MWLRRLEEDLEGRNGSIGVGVPCFKMELRNTMKYHKNILKTQNICAILLVAF